MSKTAQQIYEYYFSHITAGIRRDRQFKNAKIQEIETWLKETYADVEWTCFPVAMTEITLAWGKVESQTWSELAVQATVIPGLLTALEEAAIRLDFLTNWIENSYDGENQDVKLGRSYARAARAAVTKAKESSGHE